MAGNACAIMRRASACPCPVLSPPGIFRHQPLLAGEHAIYYEAEGDGLAKAITGALADKPRLAAMARPREPMRCAITPTPGRSNT